ncbi:MAG: protein kinase [Planctomycetes bacterium]|nr:protein kinase [Planctomycetota bacterium]
MGVRPGTLFIVIFSFSVSHSVRRGRRLLLKARHVGVFGFEILGRTVKTWDHPSIAKVFDAGATETGRPYFVMELVRGLTITEYCDKNKLNKRERLELLVPVCNAVQHAHQKGIVHRDIKPSNIMATLHDGKPVPKVIDFGIAKATNQRLTERTVFTRYAEMIGTPKYGTYHHRAWQHVRGSWFPR